MIYAVEGFAVIDEAKENVLLILSGSFHDPSHVGDVVSGSSASSEASLFIRDFSLHVGFKPALDNFEKDLAGV